MFLLFFTMLLIPVIMSMHATFNSPDTVKASLVKSNLYDSVTTTNVLLENSHLSQAAISDDAVGAALDSVITPSFVQTASEKLIDSTYAYIRGEVATPELSVDVSSAKTQFANNMALYAKQKFEALPVCAEDRMLSTSIESLLEATCVPAGVSPQQASDYARAEIMNTSLFSNDRLDVAGLAGTRNTSITTSLTELRTVYPYFISAYMRFQFLD